MAIDTPDQQITIPQGADLADVVAMIANMVADIETRLNLRYASAADRTARHPVGVTGESSDLAAEGWADSFNGTNWISRTARGYRAMKTRVTDAAPINSAGTGVALQNDAVLVAPIEAAGSFLFGGALFYDSPTAADMKMAFTWPGAPSHVRWGAMGREAATATNIAAPVTIASGTSQAFGGMGVGTPTWLNYAGFIRNTGAAGNLQLQYAQQVADPGNFTVYAGSNLWVLRVS